MRCNNPAVFQHRSSISRVFGGLLVWLMLGWAGPATGQIPALDSLNSISQKLARYERRDPHEKLFLHLDRPVYLSGETMWFKVYAVDGTFTRPLVMSSVAYVEVLNSRNQPVLQGKVALHKATGQGSFLLPAALESGRYTVRAYTSWMQNFAPETYFHSTVTVLNTQAASGAAVAADSTAAKFDGQFFPEGGSLVQGLRSKVAFKVTDPAGRGVAAEGQVLTAQGSVVATFKTLRLGMGNFTFTPTAAQEPYTAVLTSGKRQPLRRQLPPALAQGYVLRVESTSPTQLTLNVDATATQPETLFLLVHCRQKMAVATQVQLVNGHAVFTINPARLLPGISHFTLFNSRQQPVAERLYFQRPGPDQQLAIMARADKDSYNARDKVNVQVALANAQPATASLSMAVYRLDSLTAAPATTIASYLWLASDLKGPVENPDYYFTASEGEVAAAADNLMLTQGWSRFRWTDVLDPNLPPLSYLPEPYGPVIRARLTRAGTNLPRQGVMTYLASPSRITQLSNDQSNADGLVQFELHDFDGPRDIVLQTDPRQDSTCQIKVVDPFSARFASASPPAVGLTPRFQADYAKRHLQAQMQSVFFGKYRSRYAPQAADSMAFFGIPSEKYMLDKYTRFKVLEEVLREYVPGVVVRIRKDGFHFLVVDRVNQTLLFENPMVLLDGVPVFDINKMMAMPSIKIQKLEVVDSRYFHGLTVYNGIVSFTTYKGDLEGFPLDPRVLVAQYEGVQRQREFYAPRYDTPAAKQSRLPDLRNLLYWNPDINLTGTTAKTVDFYTGDQAGRYLVVLQGLSSAGQPGSSSFVLEVKPTL